MFLFNTLRNFINSLEKKFVLGNKKPEGQDQEEIEMEIEERFEIDAERMNQTYTKGAGITNKIEIFSIK